MIYKVLRRGINRLAVQQTAASAIVGMAIKASGSVLALVIFTLTARTMSADEFGLFAIWFNAVSFLGIVAVCGQDTLIARSFGEYAGKEEYGLAWGAYRFGWIWTVTSGLIFVAAFLTVGPTLFPEFSRAAFVAPAFFLFTQTTLHYSSHSARAIVGVMASETSRELIWRGLLLVAVAGATIQQCFSPSSRLLKNPSL